MRFFVKLFGKNRKLCLEKIKKYVLKINKKLILSKISTNNAYALEEYSYIFSLIFFVALSSFKVAFELSVFDA